MRIDSTKIEAKVKDLNRDAIVGTEPWVAIEGFNILPQINVEGETFNLIPGSGAPVKIFINRVTGELKIYPLVMFEIKKDGK